MKKVGILIYSLGGGGAELVACRMVHILKEKYDMTLFVMKDGVRAYEPECEVICLGKGGKNAVFNELNTARVLNKTLKKYNIDVLISLMEASNQINLLFNRTCKKILSVHCYFGKELWKTYQSSFKDKRERFFVRHFYKNADSIAVLTAVGKEAYIRDYGLSAELINVIYNPYDVAEVQSKMTEDIDDAVRKFIETHNTTVTVGRIATQKNYFQLIDAFERVRKLNKNAGLVILGKGPLEQQLRDYIETKGISESVCFAGFVKNPYSYISKCKMFVSLSNYEGFPNVMIETMACGIPVAYADCLSGPREIFEVTEKKSSQVIFTDYGMLLPDVGNMREIDVSPVLDEIARAWNDLLLDEDRRRKYASNSLKRIEAFSFENIKNRWIELIEKTIQE